MKQTPISNSEKSFITECIRQHQRIDGRKLEEFRTLNINFGSEWGSAHVALGETRVLAQVSCELGQPNQIRPNEGLLFINVELGPMAAPHFEAGRNSDLTVRINRTLERTFKDSKCVDMESLCVIADDKVWILRVDLNVLNHEGNLIDCCSVATLCALAHFKRPDITVSGTEVQVHTAAEKDLIPLVLHHFPICVSYATFHNGEMALVDPTLIEERVADANMIFGINSYKELCCLNVAGTTLTSTHLLLQCSNRAANRAKIVVDLVKEKLKDDLVLRSEGKPVGFTECLKLNKITSLAEDRLALRLPHFNFETLYKSNKPKQSIEEIEAMKLENLNDTTATLSSNQKNIKWLPETDEDDDDNKEHDMDDGDEDDDDEEEEESAKYLKRLAKDPTEQIMSKSISKRNRKGIPQTSTSAKVPSPSFRKPDSDSEEEQKMIL